MRSATLLLTLACTLVACSSSSNSGPVDSGLSAERKGSELSDAEETQLCNAWAEQLNDQLDVDDRKHHSCVANGIAAANLGGGMISTCESVYDLCLQMDYKPTDGGTKTCMLAFDLTTCNATVRMIEDCLTEQNDAAAAALKRASCDDLNKDPVTPTTGPACTTAKATCPGIA